MTRHIVTSSTECTRGWGHVVKRFRAWRRLRHQKVQQRLAVARRRRPSMTAWAKRRVPF